MSSKLTALTSAGAAADADLFYTTQSGSGYKQTASALATYVNGKNTKTNFSASTNPSTSNDNTQGYATGSVWFRTDTGETWRCRDASTNAAVWVKVDNTDFFGYVANNWYALVPPGAATQAGGSVAATTIYLTPFVIKQRVTISQLGLAITTGSSGKIQAALYNSTSSLLPGTLIDHSGDMSTTTGTVNVTSNLGSSQQLNPGLYFSAVCQDNSSAKFATMPINGMWGSSVLGNSNIATVVNPAGTSGVSGYQTTTGVTLYSTWPDLTAASFTAGVASRYPVVAGLIASVP